MKLFIVTAALKFPSCYNKGAMFEIEAESRARAISEARKIVQREMLYDRWDGPLEYRAKLSKEDN